MGLAVFGLLGVFCSWADFVVTRKGLEEGARLVVVDAGEGILFRPALTTADLAGSGSAHGTPEEMKRLLDRLREEDL